MKKLKELDPKALKERIVRLESKEQDLQKAIAKIEHAESSLEMTLSCCECMEMVKNPITLVPCGHHYCTKCLANATECKECEAEIEFKLKNKPLEIIVSKITYN
eukprot:CAMPEP_0114591672 /NCGR_PEP_ID=MMETSP0125-20121206/13665_1 /TAXON_ID=485358 ORGANISM="Aristerostoma sp., Strain ATCC 50986" /NCGR_SAMPLE_ID=MMETSP0125 /ASSEMBLY_ACC=CAM_ASM_000245 /LENGTH=103 /DNA_ID=CAMNT_0001789883 /DNA_START=669 /DNA_END=980 /DNA_ORIENTATION=+